MTATIEAPPEEVVDADWLDDWSFANARPRSYGNGIFSLKDDSQLEEGCDCADAVKWPTPDVEGFRILPKLTVVDLYDEDGEYVGYEAVELT